jgi:hypothetical protein
MVFEEIYVVSVLGLVRHRLYVELTTDACNRPVVFCLSEITEDARLIGSYIYKSGNLLQLHLLPFMSVFYTMLASLAP